MKELLEQWLLNPLVERLAAVLIGVLCIHLVVRLLQRSVGRYVTDPDMRYRGRKLLSFTGYLLAFLVVVSVFSDRLGGLSVAVGFAGAGVAFALQEVIASIAGWVAISFSGFFRPGDRVEVGGVAGDVIDVGILRTTLMELGGWIKGDSYNGRIVRIANSAVFKTPVFNYSADFPFVWDEIRFPIRYGSDWKYAREMLQRVAEEVVGSYTAGSKDAWKQVVRKYLIEDARLDPLVTLRGDENWIEYTIRYIVDYRHRRATKDRLFTRILEEVDKSEDRVRIATASFELLSMPGLSVRLKAGSGNENGS